MSSNWFLDMLCIDSFNDHHMQKPIQANIIFCLLSIHDCVHWSGMKHFNGAVGVEEKGRERRGEEKSFFLLLFNQY